MSIFDTRQDRRDSRLSTSSSGYSRGGSTSTSPVLSAITAGSITTTTATITWTTDVLADSFVYWGLSTTYLGATSPLYSSTQTLSHSVQITGLVTGTVYHYKVVSTSADGSGKTVSGDNNFTTN